MTKILDEFKTFAFRGNLLDLAAAVILGLAFNTVVQVLVDGVIMPVIAALVGRPDFDELTIGLGDAEILYGTFLTAVVILSSRRIRSVPRGQDGQPHHAAGEPSSPDDARMPALLHGRRRGGHSVPRVHERARAALNGHSG